MKVLFRVFSFIFIGILGFIFTSEVLADGCHIPEKAFIDYAKIPSQKAFISFRNGEETLIIESAVETKSPNLAWVVPLPAVPTEIEKVSPGTIKTLSFCIQPEIIHDLDDFLVFTFFVCFGLLLYWYHYVENDRKDALVIMSIWFIFWFLFSGLSLGGSQQESATLGGITLLEKSEVGSYEISSLKADNPQVLNNWLTENGFTPLNQKALEITQDYIKNDWVFCVAKLMRKDGGVSIPHPLSFKFPTETAIYPMKLTSLANSDPYFEIFVSADQQASCDLLETEFVDKYEKRIHNGKNINYPQPYYFKGENYKQNIGHNSIVPLLWNDCTITKLSGIIAAKDMTTDLVFDFKEPIPYQKLLFSDEGVTSIVIGVFVWALTVMLIFSAFIMKKKLKTKKEKWRYFLKTTPKIIIVLAALVSR